MIINVDACAVVPAMLELTAPPSVRGSMSHRDDITNLEIKFGL
jgi:hypothetical protein